MIDASHPFSRRHRLGRRAFNRRLAALGLAALWLPLEARQTRAADAITYFTWSGYEVPELHKTYIEKYGRGPDTSLFGDEEEAFQKLRSGFAADVAHPCTYAIRRWREAGLLEPIDISRLPAWPDLFERLKSVDGTVADGQHWFVPIEWGLNSILYRTDRVDIRPEEESWSILFDEKYKGRLAMFDGVEQAVFAAAMVAGLKDPFSLDDAGLATVKELLLKQKKLLRFYWSDQTALEQAIAAGEVVAALAWNASYLTLKGQGLAVRYMHPKEGNQTYVCGLVKLKGGQGPVDQAYDLINAELDPSAGKFFIEQYGYAHANRRSFEIADPAKLADLGLDHPDQLFENSVFLRDIASEALRQKYNQMFEEVKLTQN
jgi:spermidine/putrescine-binding protein